MKRKIEQILNGIFEYESPELQVSVDAIEAVVRKGENCRGSFVITHPLQKKVKGFLYAETPRAGFEPAAFSAISEKILYEIDTTGMQEGEVLEGAFTIASSLGEKALPYRVMIRTAKSDADSGTYENLEDFVKDAQEDFQKAYVYFVSAAFRELLQKKAPEWLLLYEGLMKQSVSYRSMEEFLVAAGLKEPIAIKADRMSVSYGVLTQTIQEKIVLTKNTWGFLKLDVRTDAPFLKVERQLITTDEFLGSTYVLNYLIDRSALHAGRNFGRITISGAQEEFSFEVMVHGGLTRYGNQDLKTQHRLLSELTKRYIDYRLERISASDWVREGLESYDRYINAGGSGAFIEFFRIWLLFEAKKEEEACLLMERAEQNKEWMNHPVSRGIFLYLTTFYNKDKKYQNYVEEKLNELVIRNVENWPLTWLLTNVREGYLRHPAQKLEVLREQFIFGCASRVLYLEAALILKQSPLLLKKLENFELRALKFMVREGLINSELVMQLTELAGRYREYSQELYEILTAVYEQFPSRSMLRAIVVLLLKGRKKGSEYFTWYEKGVEEELRVAGLYEYYIESLEAPLEKPLPQIIRMYFSYNNTLDYQKKAFIYANVIRNKENDPKSYVSYRPAMEKFVVDQLLYGHIDENLAYIYQTFVNRSMLTRRMAEMLSRLIFTCQLTVEDPKVKYAVVFHGQLTEEQRVAITDGKANIQIYTEDFQIFLEDESGNRFAASVPYRVRPFLDEPLFMEYCLELSPDAAGLLLHRVSRERKKAGMTAACIHEAGRLLVIEGVKEAYKHQLRQEMLDYYYRNSKEERLFDFLHEIDLTVFVQVDKYKLVELLVSEGMSREAFSLISVYGPEKVSLRSLVGLCHRMILNHEYEENEMLLALCGYCFTHGKYDELVLNYLLRYYDGPIEQMKMLWRAGKDFQADTFILEEKILLLTMFMHTGLKGTEEIFDSYRRALGRKMFLKAYVMCQAYEYLVKGEDVKAPVFRYIERGYAKRKISEDICLLALLKYYSSLEERTETQNEYVYELLETYTNRGIRMAFFQKFPLEFLRTFQLYDKTFIEYRANKKALVTITWQITAPGGQEGKIQSEPMVPVYEGIFVKEFTLFYGEKIRYHIQEEWNQAVKEVPDGLEEYREKDSTKSTQYDLLNQMSEAIQNGKLSDGEFAVLQFKEQEALAKGIFRLV